MALVIDYSSKLLCCTVVQCVLIKEILQSKVDILYYIQRTGGTIIQWTNHQFLVRTWP